MKSLRPCIYFLLFIFILSISSCLSNKADYSTPKKKDEALMNAIREKNLEKVGNLLEIGANPNAKGAYNTTPLYLRS